MLALLFGIANAELAGTQSGSNRRVPRTSHPLMTMTRFSPLEVPDWSSLLLGLLLTGAAHAASDYDPLKLPETKPAAPAEFTVVDAKRSRDLPIRVYLPADPKPAPVVLFSHGLGGSRDGNAFLGKHWAARGYAAVFLQHPGSDESVWRNVPAAQRMKVMTDAASAKNFLLRLQDVPAILDQLAIWQEQQGHPLARRMDLKRVGMSGHSFGAQTTQGVSGQSFPGPSGQRFIDARVRAAIAFSPDSPKSGGGAQAAFGAVKIPWLLMTGTKDLAIIGGATVESRLSVYPGLPPGDKYEVVLHEAEHSAFTDRALPGDSGRRNPNHHRVILALSTAFWDAFLRGDAAAKTWLNGDGPGAILEKADRWQRK
jgi:predicted dienelactone hydrolase